MCPSTGTCHGQLLTGHGVYDQSSILAAAPGTMVIGCGNGAEMRGIRAHVKGAGVNLMNNSAGTDAVRETSWLAAHRGSYVCQRQSCFAAAPRRPTAAQRKDTCPTPADLITAVNRSTENQVHNELPQHLRQCPRAIPPARDSPRRASLPPPRLCSPPLVLVRKRTAPLRRTS